MQSQKRQNYLCFQGKPLNITVIQVYAPTSTAEEAEVEWFYEDLQDFVKLIPKKDALFILGTGMQNQVGLTTNKASGGDGIPVELFQILKDDAVKVLHSICQQSGKLSSGHRTGKCQFSFQSQRKVMPKNAQTIAQSHSSHTLVK